MEDRSRPPLELWGGAECTVNRVGDTWRDQTRISGHQDRPEDLELFAALGIRKLRYPVLWERVAPDRPDMHDWSWSDDRLARIRRLGMEPIVGLLHHGSGPGYTSLVSDNFATLLGDYAGAVADRYPDVLDWTPVNEPLTTARFSALYGHWYPHARDEAQFWRALLNQIDGTCAAMRAIRRVNPAARLIQTEDLGRAYSRDGMAAVAEHYNQRRWMTWDLLAGRVTPDHALWERLAALGFGDRLRAIADDPCPADMLGINHYVTSDRFLDDRAEAHVAPLPAAGFHDLTAARVLDPPAPGLAGALSEAWARYRIPIAVTESHLNCTREEQVRWIGQGWRDCLAMRERGVDVRALTAWALLGSTDWVHLLTRDAGAYETGAFDVRGERPRMTAVGRLLASLGGAVSPSPGVAAALAGSGWWQRDIRLEHPPHRGGVPRIALAAPASTHGRPLLITGGNSALGQMLARVCRTRGLDHVLPDPAAKLHEPAGIAAMLDRHRPWAVIDAADRARVDEAREGPDACDAADADRAGALAKACAERAIHCTLFASPLVSDDAAVSYDEASVPTPLDVCEWNKADAEVQATTSGARVLTVRTAAIFSPHDSDNFAAELKRALRLGQPFAASSDYRVTPTYLPDLVQAVLDLVVDEATGTWHLTSGEALSWFAFAHRLAEVLKLNPDLIVAAEPIAPGGRARPSTDSSLVPTRSSPLPPLADALARYSAIRGSEAGCPLAHEVVDAQARRAGARTAA